MNLAGRVLPMVAILASGWAISTAQSTPPVKEPNLAQLNESGHVAIAGRSVPYLIRHLPVSSFPQLPAAIGNLLTERGCMIPQTYEAHRPENAIHGSFEKPGSSDWAVLCSAHGTASLLVFFSSAPEKPSVLATSPETNRLQVHDLTGVLGFNWGIDAATPERVREAQSGMEPRPPRLDHDAVATSVVEHRTVYHYYAKGAWSLVDTGN
jgi:hypothetical protein